MKPTRALPLACCLTLAVLGVGVLLRAPTPRAEVSPASATPARVEAAALAVLRAWDARRAAAWANGDPAALRRLYLSGSRTGRADRAMLAAYADRGLRVTGIRMQVLAVSVRRSGENRLLLRVTDRLTGAVAVGSGVRVRLPRDRPSTRLVELVLAAGQWRVREVWDQDNPAASTAATSGSRNW